jgi:hypothetical protein
MEKKPASPPVSDTQVKKPKAPDAKETGGPKGPEPTRYGDWEIGGKCVDF